MWLDGMKPWWIKLLVPTIKKDKHEILTYEKNELFYSFVIEKGGWKNIKQYWSKLLNEGIRWFLT